MKKSLFDVNDRYEERAMLLDSEIAKALRPIFKKYIDQGYSIREIAAIASHTVLDLECDYVLDKSSQKKIRCLQRLTQ